MSDRVIADNDTLLRQASMTAHEYFHDAIKTIDDEFGDGFAKGHPELIAGFMQAAAHDFHAGITTRALQEIADAVASRNNVD
jgi:hypothetical protein